MRRFETAKPHDAGTQAFKRSTPAPDAERTCRRYVSPGEWSEEKWLYQWGNKGVQAHLHEWRF